MHVVLDQRRVRYIVVSADEVRRFAPLPRTVYLVIIMLNSLLETVILELHDAATTQLQTQKFKECTRVSHKRRCVTIQSDTVASKPG